MITGELGSLLSLSIIAVIVIEYETDGVRLVIVYSKIPMPISFVPSKDCALATFQSTLYVAPTTSDHFTVIE